MKNELIKPQISILSSDESTIKLLGMSLDFTNFSNEVLPEQLTLEDLLMQPSDVIIIDEQNPIEMLITDICKLIRTKNEEVIIIILANKFDILTKILMIEFGADDYLEKPANPLEIMARIKATLRRHNFATKTVLEESEFRLNDLYIDASRHICIANGNQLNLTNYEFLTLLQLVKFKGKTVERGSLLTDIWGLANDDNMRIVDDIIRRLRKKLKSKQSSTQILTMWGHGYRIEA